MPWKELRWLLAGVVLVLFTVFAVRGWDLYQMVQAHEQFIRNVRVVQVPQQGPQPQPQPPPSPQSQPPS